MIPEMVELDVHFCGKGISEDHPDRLEQALERAVQRPSAIVRAARVSHDSELNLFLIPFFLVAALIQVVNIGRGQFAII